MTTEIRAESPYFDIHPTKVGREVTEIEIACLVSASADHSAGMPIDESGNLNVGWVNWDWTVNQMCVSVQIAVDEINSRIDILPDVRLRVSSIDTDGSQGIALVATLNAMENGANAFIGDGPVGEQNFYPQLESVVASIKNVPYCTPSSTDTEISNKQLYPTLFRTQPLIDIGGIALADTINLLGFKKVHVFVGMNSGYGPPFYNSFVRRANYLNITILQTTYFYEKDFENSDWDTPIIELKRSKAKVLVMLTEVYEMDTLYVKAFLQGAIEWDFKYFTSATGLMADSLNSLKDEIDPKFNHTFEDVPNFGIQGPVTITETPQWKMLADIFAMRTGDLSMLFPPIEFGTIPTSYDCVYAIAKGWHRMMQRYPNEVTAENIKTNTVPSKYVVPAEFSFPGYQGASMILEFNDNGDPNWGGIIIVQQVGFNTEFLWDLKAPIWEMGDSIITNLTIINNATSLIPNYLDYPEVIQMNSIIDLPIYKWLSIAPLISGSLLLLMVLVFRNSRLVVAMGPFHLGIYGLISILGGILIFCGMGIPTEGFCSIQFISLGVGYAMVNTNILAKAIRFINRTKRNNHTGMTLLFYLQMFAVIGFLNLAWIFSLKPVAQPILLSEFSSYVTCVRSLGYSDITSIIFVFYNLLILLVANGFLIMSSYTSQFCVDWPFAMLNAMNVTILSIVFGAFISTPSLVGLGIYNYWALGLLCITLSLTLPILIALGFSQSYRSDVRQASELKESGRGGIGSQSGTATAADSVNFGTPTYTKPKPTALRFLLQQVELLEFTTSHIRMKSESQKVQVWFVPDYKLLMFLAIRDGLRLQSETNKKLEVVVNPKDSGDSYVMNMEHMTMTGAILPNKWNADDGHCAIVLSSSTVKCRFIVSSSADYDLIGCLLNGDNPISASEGNDQLPRTWL